MIFCRSNGYKNIHIYTSISVYPYTHTPIHPYKQSIKMMKRRNEWWCEKCKEYISDAVDTDYHDNTIHPNFTNPFVASWYARGCPGLSPYD